jgi:hypothetical protein
MPSLMVTTLSRGRARVSLDLSTAGRRFTPAGLSAVVAAYQRHTSHDLARAVQRRYLMASRSYGFGHVALTEAEPLSGELPKTLAVAGMREEE